MFNTTKAAEEAKPFDLIEMQGKVRDCLDLRQLYYMWDYVCRLYEKKTITSYEFTEMRDCIFPIVENLVKIKNSIK